MNDNVLQKASIPQRKQLKVIVEGGRGGRSYGELTADRHAAERQDLGRGGKLFDGDAVGRFHGSRIVGSRGKYLAVMTAPPLARMYRVVAVDGMIDLASGRGE